MYTPRQSAVWLRPLRGATARSGGDQYSVLFQLFARGVTAMLRGQHVGLCHAFLVITTSRHAALRRYGLYPLARPFVSPSAHQPACF